MNEEHEIVDMWDQKAGSDGTVSNAVRRLTSQWGLPQPKTERLILIEFDGGCRPSNPGNKYGSFSVIRDGFEVLRQSEVEFGKGTNNEAEFNALELALSEAVSDIHGADALCSGFRLKILTDSMIVKNRLVGKNRATVFRKHKESSNRMITHANRCLELMERFESFTVEWQPRGRNVANFGH